MSLRRAAHSRSLGTLNVTINRSKVDATLQRIGRQLVLCDVGCAGIRCDQSAGIPPRGLIFEFGGRASGRGSAVIGINPGHARPREIKSYLTNGTQYEVVLKYWQDIITAFPYYTKIRRFLDQVGLRGPILWSELAKCENAAGSLGLPPLKTLRTCTGRFLNRELELIPKSWPLIGLGGEAFKALAYLYPSRTVIGLPHPTGSYGHFSQLMPGNMLAPEIRRTTRKILSKRSGDCVWLKGERRKRRGA